MFSNLLSGIGDYLSSAYNTTKNTLSNLFSGASTGASNLLAGVGAANIYGPEKIASGVTQPSTLTAGSVPNPAGQYNPYVNLGNVSPFGTPPNQQLTQNMSSTAFVSGFTNPDFYNVRPSSVTPNNAQQIISQYSNQYSNQSAPANPFAILSQGQSGQQGFGGTGLISLSPTSASGNQGTGGGSSFTGTLGATGGAGTGTSTTSDEEARKKANLLNSTQPLPTPSLLKTGSNGLPIYQPWPNTVTTTPLPSTPIQPKIDLGSDLTAQSRAQATNQAMGSMGSINGVPINSMDDLNAYFNNAFAAEKQKLDQQQPTPPNPVANDQAQSDWLKQQADPFGAQQLIDAYKAADAEYSALEAQRIDVMKNIQSVNNISQAAIDDVKKNPDMPKQLAAKRLTQIGEDNKTRLLGLVAQKDLLDQQISDKNSAVNRKLQIATTAVNQAQQAQSNARSTLQLLISTGGIAALTPSEINTFATTTGIPSKTIQTMVSSAKDPSMKVEMVGSADTGYKLVTYNIKTGEVTKTSQVTQPSANNSQTTTDIQNQLTATKGGDGYVNADKYAQLRATSKISASDFDNRFGYLTNPNDRARLGIGVAATSQVQTKGQLNEQQQAEINNAKAAWSTAQQTLQATPQLRQQLIDLAKQRIGIDIGPYF